MDNNKSYDEDPVFYCRRCLSLNIKDVPLHEEQCYCGECGCTEVDTADIEEWKKMYREKYGRDFVVKRVLKWPYWY